MGNTIRQVVVLRQVVATQKEYWCGLECIWRKQPGLYINIGSTYPNRKYDTGIHKKSIILFYTLYTHFIFLIPYLLIITVFPEHADANNVLTESISTSHIGTGKVPKSTRIGFKALVNGN